MPPAAKSGWESDVPREVNPRRRTLGPNVALWGLLLAPGSWCFSAFAANCQVLGVLLLAAGLVLQVARPGGRQNLRIAVRTAPHDDACCEAFFCFLP